MAKAAANGIELEYDDFGDPADPALLLVMGLGTQMTGWPEAFCGLLAGRGYRVVRFDNRDIGLSTQFDHLPTPDVMAILGGDHATVPYLLADLAEDAVGLLDALGIERAHVVGASMGGMIVQEMAIKHQDRLLSLCSIMSTTGDREVGQASPEAMTALLSPPGGNREDAIARSMTVQRTISSPGYPPADEWLRERATLGYDRAFRPAGSARQLAAIIGSPDRTAALGAVTVPTVVLHGEQDPLVNVSGGKATAAAIPGARLVLFPGMGHDLPEALFGPFADAIADNAARAAAQ